MKKELYVADAAVEKNTFHETHEIECVADGKPLVAFVTAKVKYPIDWAFQVNFSDGFEAIFIENGDTWWVEEKPWGKKYAEAIKKPLKDFLFTYIKNATASSLR